jgi:hypothetical protein
MGAGDAAAAGIAACEWDGGEECAREVGLLGVVGAGSEPLLRSAPALCASDGRAAPLVAAVSVPASAVSVCAPAKQLCTLNNRAVFCCSQPKSAAKELMAGSSCHAQSCAEQQTCNAPLETCGKSRTKFGQTARLSPVQCMRYWQPLHLISPRGAAIVSLLPCRHACCVTHAAALTSGTLQADPSTCRPERWSCAVSNGHI